MLRDVFSVKLQSLPPPRVTEIILQNVVILPPTSSFKSSSGLAHFTPALKVCFMSLVNIIASLIGWILASSVHNGFIGEDEVKIQEALPHKRVKGLVTTGAGSHDKQTRNRASLTFGLLQEAEGSEEA